MQQFFLAVGLIGIVTILIILYYVLKYIFSARKNSIISEQIKSKMYQDDRLMLQSRLRYKLHDLQSGKINWIVLSARNDQRIRIELTYNQINDKVEIRDHSNALNAGHIQAVKKIGVKNCKTDGGVNVICASPNPKIITDVIYFLIEDVNNIRAAINFKLSDSGVYNGKNSRITR